MISENPYLQYFLSFKRYERETPYYANMMTHFRKRFGAQDIKGIDELLHTATIKSKNPLTITQIISLRQTNVVK